MTKKQQALVKKYINLFDLHNFDISVSISDEVEQGKDAQCYYCLDSMTAMIFIHPKSDFELCLIHEYLHLIAARSLELVKTVVEEFVPNNQQVLINKLIDKSFEEMVLNLEKIYKKGDLKNVKDCRNDKKGEEVCGLY